MPGPLFDIMKVGFIVLLMHALQEAIMRQVAAAVAESVDCNIGITRRQVGCNVTPYCEGVQERACRTDEPKGRAAARRLRREPLLLGGEAEVAEGKGAVVPLDVHLVERAEGLRACVHTRGEVR